VNNNSFLIPANTKSGALILNIFNLFDVILLLSGVGVTLIMLFILPLDTLTLTLVALAPALICAFLVLPIPNYHNVLTVLVGAINFFSERRVFIWKGWCLYGREEDKK
jgi:prepilin signal peptidase PulO-like enzyme (type II secretory pathway)